MLPPHILEREDRKTLSLLAFALEAAGIDRRRWSLAYDRDALVQPIDDCLCLFKQAGEWLVTYTERGGWSDIGRFARCADAIKFVHAYLVPGASPYDCRKVWEARTGQQFSMQE
jgi:hypothetical protein